MAQTHGTELPQCPAQHSRAQLSWEELQDRRNWAPAPGTRIPGEGWCWGAWGSSRPGQVSLLQDSTSWGAAASSWCWHWVAPARTWHRAGCPGHIPLGTAPEQPGVWGRQWRTFPGESAVPVESDPGACQVPELPCTAEQYLPQRFPSVTRLCHLSVTELVKANPIL